MKKWMLFVLLTLLCAVLLTGCGHEHEWQEATCTAPRTCAECGETEGEVLMHDWQEATCDTPMTCAVCGATEGMPQEHDWLEATCAAPMTCAACGDTEGEALEHDWLEATYQTAATCAACGEVDGTPLQADFVTYGIRADMQQGVEYTFQTVTADGTKPVTAKATVTGYEVIESDELRQAREGYEWHGVTIETLFDDPVAMQEGAQLEYCCADYYNIAAFADSADHSDAQVSAYQINYNGEDQLVYFGQNGDVVQNPDGTAKITITFWVQKPIGYDGIVIGVHNGAIDVRISGEYLYNVYAEEDFCLFRLHP